jgi:hypothetical protein
MTIVSKLSVVGNGGRLLRIPKNGWLRRVVSLCGFLVMQIGAVYGQTQTPRGELKTVKLGLPSISASQMPPLIAKELGYYRQEGFDVEIILMRAVTTVQGLIAGSLDYNGTPGATIAAAVQVLKLRVLVAYSERALYDLVVHPDITSVCRAKRQDLRHPISGGVRLRNSSRDAEQKWHRPQERHQNDRGWYDTRSLSGAQVERHTSQGT